jgi:hypothetical protein
MRRRTRVALVGGAVVGAVALRPSLALAHGLVGRADLPIPSWLFGWAAAIVLAVSFAALAALWPEPRLQHPRERRLFRIPAAVDVVCGAIGIGIFVLVVYAGFAGTRVANRNLAPNVVYIEFWVGWVVASLLLGDVFRAFNPWRAFARAVAFAGRLAGVRRRPRPYPARLGRWPAVIGIACFAWLELAADPLQRVDPPKLAVIVLAFAAIQLIGFAFYGIEAWGDRADAFGVYFNLYSRLAVFERREATLYLRPPLSGAPRWPILPGSVALLCVAIGSTTFDGFSNGPVWASIYPDLQSAFAGLGTTAKQELANTVGLLGCVLAVGGFYRLGIEGMRTVGHGHDSRELLGRFAHTLIPIAFAYAIAHYFSLLLYNGQAIGSLISDPLGDGSNIFGTAHATIDYGILSGAGIWYVQVGALICGHVAGLVLAHDRALAIYNRVGEATRSQYWMLVVMVGFTSLGLWLLSAVHA